MTVINHTGVATDKKAPQYSCCLTTIKPRNEPRPGKPGSPVQRERVSGRCSVDGSRLYREPFSALTKTRSFPAEQRYVDEVELAEAPLSLAVKVIGLGR